MGMRGALWPLAKSGTKRKEGGSAEERGDPLQPALAGAWEGVLGQDTGP